MKKSKNHKSQSMLSNPQNQSSAPPTRKARNYLPLTLSTDADMPHSHHSHSGQFCSHAKSTLSEVVSRAKLLGFSHFHLSEHVFRSDPSHLYPEEIQAGITPSCLLQTFKSYLIEARRLSDEYSSKGLEILVGAETEYISESSLDLLQPFLPQLDYLVGSIHHSFTIPIDFDLPTFKMALEQAQSYSNLIHQYLDHQFSLIQRFQPEVIGHFDLFRLYYPDLLPFQNDIEIQTKLFRNIDKVMEYGGLFECNSAAFRKGWKTCYPATDLLTILVQRKARLCLSDDSHGVDNVASFYPQMNNYLIEQGVQEIWYLSKSVVSENAFTRFSRGTVANRLCLQEWQSHPFWNQYQQVVQEQSSERDPKLILTKE